MKQPNPTSLIDTLDYIEDQARQGHIKGGGPLTVLTYMAKNSWRKTPNNENAPIGAVLSGKSRMSTIAEGCAISRPTVVRSIDWLELNDWITVKQMIRPGGGKDFNQYTHLLDTSGHMKRQAMYDLGIMEVARHDVSI